MRTILLEFKGFYLEPGIKRFPEGSGIYCVYASARHISSESGKSTVSIKKLLYIGEADDMKNEIMENEERKKWQEALAGHQILCFNYASIRAEDGRSRARAALLYKYLPLLNKQENKSFNYGETEVLTSGENIYLGNFILK